MESIQVQANIPHNPQPGKGISILRIPSNILNTRTTSKHSRRLNTTPMLQGRSKNTNINQVPTTKENGKEDSEMAKALSSLVMAHHIAGSGRKAMRTDLEYSNI